MGTATRSLWLAWGAIAAACTFAFVLGAGLYATAASEETLESELARSTELVAESLAASLSRALALGVPLDALPGIPPWFDDLLADNPVVRAVGVADASGRPLAVRGDAPALGDAAAVAATGGPSRGGSSGRFRVSLPLRASPDAPVAGWLHVAVERQAGGMNPFVVSAALAAAFVLLAAGLLYRLVSRRLAEPLAEVRAAVDALAAGRVPPPGPRDRRRASPAFALRAALSQRLEALEDRGDRLLQKLGEVRAAHFDPAVLARIDALAAPLLARPPSSGAAAPGADRTAASRRELLPALWIGAAAAIATVAIAGQALVAQGDAPQRRALVQATASLLERAWADALGAQHGALDRLLERTVPRAAGMLAALETDPERIAAELADPSADGEVITVLRPDGSPLGSTAPLGRRPWPASAVLERLRASGEGGTLRGAWQGADRSYQAGVAVVALDAAGRPYLLVATRPLKHVLDALGADLRSPVALADRRGRSVFDAGAPLADAWRAAGDGGRVGGYEGVPSVLVGVPVQSLAGTTLGTLVVARPFDGAPTDREQALRALAYLAMAGAAFALLRLLARRLSPVARSAERLARIADGDLRAEPETASASALVPARVDATIDRLRDTIESLEALRRSRDRQGRRQARFIHYQMMTLAERLEPAAREAVLEDLRRIEQAGRTPAAPDAGAGADGRFERVVDEVGVLALGFQSLVGKVGDQYQQLAAYVAELREALRVKTQFIALQQELEIARKIQLSFLPTDFDVHPGLRLHAVMNAAKEVGGDFYDLYALDEHRVAVTVADVSGKGVPAAFFMAVSRTLLRAIVRLGESPAPSLERLNDLLAEDNREMMFVTLFHAVIDTRDGTIEYCNAGHNPPYVVRADGSVEMLPPTGDVAIAVMGGMPYSEGRATLAPGESLVLFTDGVTEACNAGGEFFGDARLEALLAGVGREPVARVTGAIVEAVAAFEDGSPQTDDVTSVVIRLEGRAE